jgi:hypothetical protein
MLEAVTLTTTKTAFPVTLPPVETPAASPMRSGTRVKVVTMIATQR